MKTIFIEKIYFDHVLPFSNSSQIFPTQLDFHFYSFSFKRTKRTKHMKQKNPKKQKSTKSN